MISNYEFETLLLGFSDSIEIIEPEDLRERIRGRARKIIEKNTICAD
ncbi:MAG: WYL domain-containing protein [Bacteroidales bacterium]